MNKIALITGTSSGIGQACAYTLAEQKIDLIVCGRNQAALIKLKNDLEKKESVNVLPLVFDVSNSEQVKAALESLPAAWSSIHILINNAGLALGLEPLQQGHFNDWDTMIDTNIKGVLYVTKIVANQMIAHSIAGHIVNIGSTAGKDVYANGNVYCATKHAVDALNKAMRIDLLPHGIRVTGVHPGAVETQFSITRFKGDAAQAKKVYQGFTPLAANDVAACVWFALSQPPHVNINDLVVCPTAQANAYTIRRTTP